MRNQEFEQFSAEERQRFAAIEGRQDLFETKLLAINAPEAGDQPESEPHLLVLTRDPGSANAVVPVMEYFQHQGGVEMHALADGRAREILEKKFHATDITPESFLGTDQVIRRPDVLLADASSEQGIETYAAATFHDAPMVLVEDYYTSSHHYLTALQERGLRLPEKICVMDEAAKDMLIAAFPDLAERVEVTGQPAFDRFAEEKTEKISAQVRSKLELGSNEKLVAYMSTGVDSVQLADMAGAMKDMHDQFRLAFRKHPRDNQTYEQYEAVFKKAGLRTVPVEEFTTDEVSAAADVVMTSWSTEGLHGIYRRKPTIHLIDREHLKPPPQLQTPLPMVKVGASLGVDRMRALPDALQALLDPTSPVRKTLDRKMRERYPVDGKNTARVASVVERYFPR